MSWVRKKLETFINRTACYENNKEYSYKDFIKLIEKANDNLPKGKQQIIEVSCKATLEGLATLLAISESKHIALPLPPELTNEELKKIRKTVSSSNLYKQLKGSGLIIFSSGTSKEPKGMLHNFDALIDRYKNVRGRNDRCLLLLMIDHIGGLDTAFRCLFAGSTIVIPKDKNPNSVGSLIEKYKVNVLPASPTFFNLLLMSQTFSKYDFSSVEILAYGAETMPDKLLQKLSKTFCNAKLQQKFGTSETGAIHIKSVDNKSLFFTINDSDTEWKIINNELWLKTPSRILGYLNAEEKELDSNGWYATGDLVESDKKENIRIIGRTSSIINVGGNKVHPNEVESVLMEIDEIQSVYVYGKKDSIIGNIVA